MIMSFNMIQIWNSRIACNDGIACLLWAFSTDFRVLWVSPLSWRSAEDPHALLSCQTTSPLHFPLQGLDKVALLHTLQDFHGTGQCPAFRGLERQMTPMAVSSVRPVVFTGPPRAPSCFSPPRWRGALSRSAAAALSPARQRRRFGSLSGCGDSAFSTAAVILLAWRRQSRLARRRRRRRFDSLGGGLPGLVRRHCFCYCRQPLHFGPGFGVCGTTVMVVLASSPGCPSRHEPARSQGFQIPADNFPNELARV